MQAILSYVGDLSISQAIEVRSSDFPVLERNLNADGNNYHETEWMIAENSFHHSLEYPSRMVLPVIPDG